MLRFTGSQRVGHDSVTELNSDSVRCYIGKRYMGTCTIFSTFFVSVKLLK